MFVSRTTDCIFTDAVVAVENDRESAALAAKILPASIVMSQQQKSEGEIKLFVPPAEVLEIVPAPSQAEILLRVTSGIAAELIKAHDSGQSVSLNEVRAKISKKHGYGGVPRLVDIISAIPDDYKKALLPKLRARPIRTASGVCFILPSLQLVIPRTLSIDRRGCSHVQTSQMPPHSHDRQYLCVCVMHLMTGFTDINTVQIEFPGIAPVVPTRISTIVPKVTLVMNRQV